MVKTLIITLITTSTTIPLSIINFYHQPFSHLFYLYLFFLLYQIMLQHMPIPQIVYNSSYNLDASVSFAISINRVCFGQLWSHDGVLWDLYNLVILIPRAMINQLYITHVKLQWIISFRSKLILRPFHHPVYRLSICNHVSSNPLGLYVLLHPPQDFPLLNLITNTSQITWDYFQ